MIFESESLSLLRNYLVKILPPTYEEKPDAIVDYIVALLDRSKPREELQTTCAEQLQPFFKEKTKEFVNVLFGLLKEDSNTGKTTFLNPGSISGNPFAVPPSPATESEESDDEDRDHKHARKDYKKRRQEEEKNGDSFSEKRRRKEDDIDHKYQHLSSRSYGKRGRFDGYSSRGRDLDSGRVSDSRDYRSSKMGEHDRLQRSRYGYSTRGPDSDENETNLKFSHTPYTRSMERANYNYRKELDHDSTRETRRPRTGMDDKRVVASRAPISQAELQQQQQQHEQEQQQHEQEQQQQPLEVYDPERPSMTTSFKKQQPLLPFSSANIPSRWPFPMVPQFPINLSRMGQQQFPVTGLPIGMTPMIPTSNAVSNLFREEDAVIQVGGKGMYHRRGSSNAVRDTITSSLHSRKEIGSSLSGDASIETSTGSEKREYTTENKEQNDTSVSESMSTKERSSYSKGGYTSSSYPLQATVVIANIPESLNNIEKLNSHFKTFGNIVNIQVRPDLNKAFVQFSQHEEAQRAMNSPQAVLNNRFIKVYWSKRLTHHAQDKSDKASRDKEFSSKMEPTIPVSKPTMIDTEKTTETSATSSTLSSSTIMSASESPVSVVTFARPTRRSVKRKIERDPKKINSSPNEEVKELRKKKEGLRKSQLEDSQRLLDKLSGMKNVDSQVKSELLKKISSLTASIESSLAKDKALSITTDDHTLRSRTRSKVLQESSSGVQEKEISSMESVMDGSDIQSESSIAPKENSSGSHIEKLQKKYDYVQRTAAMLGISENSPSSSSLVMPTRKKGSRGRGLMEEYALSPARSIRKRSAMVLDNRPTALKINNIPPSMQSESALLSHFKAFGEVVKVSIAADGESAYVHYLTRKAAEKAAAKGKVVDSHTLKMSWYNPKESEKLALDQSNNETASSVDSAASSVPPGDAPLEPGDNGYESDEEEVDEDKSWKH